MENKFFSPLEGFEEEITVCGVPFRVHRENKMVCPLPYDDNYYGSEGPGKVNIGKKCEALFFLGLTTRDFKCSEWWGQKEAKYDFSTRLFIGDRVGPAGYRV